MDWGGFHVPALSAKPASAATFESVRRIVRSRNRSLDGRVLYALDEVVQVSADCNRFRDGFDTNLVNDFNAGSVVVSAQADVTINRRLTDSGKAETA